MATERPPNFNPSKVFLRFTNKLCITIEKKQVVMGAL